MQYAKLCPWCDGEELDDGYCHACDFDADDYDDVLKLINRYRATQSLSPLRHDGENDFTLRNGETSCWITVDNLSVYLLRTHYGVLVKVYDEGNEMGSPLASADAYGAEDDYEPET